MKKLYFLNEEEKQRILNLHNQKKHGYGFLNEQFTDVGNTALQMVNKQRQMEQNKYNPTETPLVNPLNSGGIENPDEALTIPPAGTWTLSAQGDFKRLLDEYVPGSSNRWTWQNTVSKWCETNIYNQSLGPNSFPTTTLKTIVDRVGRTLAQNTYTVATLTNRGVTAAAVEMFKNELLSLKNVPNFCHANKFKSMAHTSSGENLMEMFDEISDNNVFVSEIIGSLRSLAENTKVVKGGTSGTDDGTKKNDDADWEKTKLEFYKTYPCLADLAVASKARNAIVVQNPSEHEQIINQSQRKKTEITDKTTFLMDGTYVTYTDAKANTVSGKFQCSRDGELTLLYPGAVGMGSEGGIYSKYPCLAQPRKSGDPYTELDPSDNNQAIMSDEDRKEHPIFSGYPSGDIYFNSDGTFLTENDFNNDLDKTGNFRCKTRGRIYARPFSAVSNEPLPSPQEKKSSSGGGGVIPPVVGGMGTVMSSVQGEIAEILKCANITGTVLNQSNLNQLYQFIKNNKK